MWYTKRTTGLRVYLVGHHPMKDMVAVTAGENDLRWIPFVEFFEKYEKDSDDA